MKKFISLMVLGLAFALLFTATFPAGAAKEDLSGTISMSGAWALYPMAVKWGEEFQKVHPGVKIDLSAGGAGKGMADALAGIADIGMVSRDVYPEEIAKGAWYVAVTKDAVVPVVNEGNPYLKDLMGKGVKKDTLNGIWITEAVKTWGDLVGKPGQLDPISVYTRSDACGAAEIWAKFFGKKQEDLKGTGVYGDPGIAQAVQKDIMGIGYNNINFAYDVTTRKPNPGLKVLPIDVNGNGKLDAEENFYGSLDQIDKAIAEGKYPSPPARELYLVSQGKPQKKLVSEFIKWILTDGQKFVPESGYIKLTDAKLQAELKKLEGK